MPKIAADDSLVTTREVAEILGVPVRTVYRLRERGVLNARKYRGRGLQMVTRYSRREVEAYRDSLPEQLPA